MLSFNLGREILPRILPFILINQNRLRLCQSIAESNEFGPIKKFPLGMGLGPTFSGFLGSPPTTRMHLGPDGRGEAAEEECSLMSAVSAPIPA